MSATDATPDRSAEPIRFGQRLKILRTRRGMTRDTLGGLLSHTGQWVKDLETGRLQVPRFDTVLQLADALRVRDLSDLTGRRPLDVGMFIGPGHPRLAAVAAAVNTLPMLLPDRPAPTLEQLRTRLDAAWATRHQSGDHRDRIGALLPSLITDAQLTVRQAEAPAGRRAALALLAETYALAQFFAAYQPDSSLLWRVAERGMVAAQESEDPRAIGVAAWLNVQAHRDSGQKNYAAAEQITAQTLEYLAPLLPDAADRVRAIAGALEFEAGFTAARQGEHGTAWGAWDRARTAANGLPGGFYDPVTSFGQAIIGAHATTVAVELHAGAESVRQAARSEAQVIPSHPRRARHRIEQARAYQLDRQPDAAMAMLEHAWEAAPETVRYNGYAKAILLEAVESPVPARRERSSHLAVKVGLLAAA